MPQHPHPQPTLSFLAKYLEIDCKQASKVQQHSFTSSIKSFWYKDKYLKLYHPKCQEFYERELKALERLRDLQLVHFKSNREELLVRVDGLIGRTLSQQLYQSRLENRKSQQIFNIVYYPAFHDLKKDGFRLLKLLVIRVCKFLQLIQGKLILFNLSLTTLCGSIHQPQFFDFETGLTCNSISIGQLSIGSTESPLLRQGDQWRTIPELLAPEVISSLIRKQSPDFFQTPSAVDMYSLGCVLIEIMQGFPLWSPYRVMANKKLHRVNAIAACKKNLLMIGEVQIREMENIIRGVECDQQWKRLIRWMVEADPYQRCTPSQALEMIGQWCL